VNRMTKPFEKASEATRLSEEVSKETVTMDKLPPGHPALNQCEKPKRGCIKDEKLNETMSQILLGTHMQK